MTRSDYTEGTGWKQDRSLVLSNAAALQQLLDDTTGTEEFRAIDVDLSDGDFHQLVQLFEPVGVIEKVRRETIDRSQHDEFVGEDTTRRLVYRWRPGPREDIEGILDDLDTFPDCGHRVHIYNPRGSDEDTLGCRECGAEYPKSLVRKIF
jgi:hypothetical protein